MTDERTLTDSQQNWLRVHSYLRANRHQLAVQAADLYPDAMKVAGTGLLTVPTWLPDAPIPLDRISIELRDETPQPRITGVEPAAVSVLPVRPDDTRYGRYSEVVADLAAPKVFQNRSTYRLLDADLAAANPRMMFGRGSYFDGIDVGEATAHEYAASVLDEHTHRPFRDAIGDPCRLGARPVNMAISTLTIRFDRATGEAGFFLHWRDPAKVGHAGGLYMVVPVGVFQASGDAKWNERNDFSLWRGMIREFAEELLGESEDYNSEAAPIDYTAWPFAARITESLEEGATRAWCLGLGVDPLTFATDLLTAVVIDARAFDDLFGNSVAINEEGAVVTSLDGAACTGTGVPLVGDVVDRLVHTEKMQAAGAALIDLAWRNRSAIIR